MRFKFLIGVAAVVAVTFGSTSLAQVSASRSQRTVDLGFVAPELCPEPIDTALLTAGGQQVLATTTGKKPKNLIKVAKRDRSVAVGSASYITGEEHSAMLTAQKPALAATTCRAASIDSWFVGGSGVLESQSTIVMINQSASAATAEVSVWTPNGPVAPSTLTIPALGVTKISLDRYAAATIVTRVRALSGRIGLYMSDQRARGLTKLGGDYVAAQATPERKSVILGVAGKSASRLRLLVPGTQDAVVRVDVAFGADRYTPAGWDSLQVKAGTVVELPLNLKTSTGYGAVIVDADVPVVAGVYMPLLEGKKQRDFAWLAPSSPLTTSTIALATSVAKSSLLIFTESAMGTLSTTNLAGKGNASLNARPIAIFPLKSSVLIQPNSQMYVSQILTTKAGVSILPLNPIERAQKRLAPLSDLGVLAPR